MTDDLLKQATQALRDEGEETQGSDLTRARIMLGLHAAKRKRRSRIAFGIPLVAVFVAGAAAAQISGALPRAIERVVGVFAGESVGPSSPEEPKKSQRAPLVSATPTEPDPVPPPEEVDPEAEPELGEQASIEGDDAPGQLGADEAQGALEPPNVAAKPKPSAAAPRATGDVGTTPTAAPGAAVATSASASAAAPAASDPSHRRYLEAHQAHFGAHDYARALTLWERYLQEFPRGRFAAEAQYNRALCLVRLGRTAEAKQALEPFASGRFGGYRQSEAQALVKALGN
ncbi:MAG: tetratricopeptide repeat protein [Myxococcales bacterium]|nr:tetratricopeptide repeat protein [Myxococcales bacterium]